MPSIEGVSIRKILDSRGNATIEVDIRLGRAIGRAAAASGASTGKYEPPAFPNGGVTAAIAEFQTTVAPRLRGLEVEDQVGLDAALHSIDGTDQFSRIGGKVAAAAAGLPLFRWVAGKSKVAMPFPLGNVIGGGRHAIGGTTIQEYLVVSQSPKAADNVFANASVHGVVRDALAKKFPNDPLGRGDEGAWIAKLKDEEALALLAEVCAAKSRDLGFPVSPALDLAASEFFRGGRYQYKDRSLTREGQIDFVEDLVRKYALFSVEDPFDQEDFAAFAELTKRVGDRCKVIGDDIFVTNVKRLRQGIESRAANAVPINPTQLV